MSESENKPSASSWLAGGCPVIHKDKENGADGTPIVNPSNQMLIQEKQAPSVGQSKPLPTNRMMSSIPKGEYNPSHQEEVKEKWEYPSPQMFYNAMKRKGWEPQEDDMSTIVSIHNAVNETAWEEVMEWERQFHRESFDEVKLARFMGRPRDLTPKAFFRSLLGQERPFDRHDWYLQRGEEEVRYVIDFYNVRNGSEDPVGVYIDARPAIDSPGSVLDRLRMGVKRLLHPEQLRPQRLACVPTAAAVSMPERAKITH